MEETMSVYRVTEVIGTSPVGWAEAAKEAVQTAALSLRDLRIAEVVSQDMTINEKGKIESYRTKLRVSFKYERPIGAPEWEQGEAHATR
jgi:flavin-binding protein dodecin